MRTVRFGVVGCGMMGKEFASAAARWCHLVGMDVRPEITAACDTGDAALAWFVENVPSVRQSTGDYREILANDEVEAVYCAVPHNLHERFYCDIISSGKHLMGEKPFGIDKPGNDAIMDCVAEHPDVFVRCSSEYPFVPAMQRLCDMIEAGEFGKIVEVNTGFLHSSDMDPNKPINWKRMIEFNGEYGCLGDLGMHACHVPFRAGWVPLNVRAVLSDLVTERPDGKGGTAPCETWDNATLLCETRGEDGGVFPWTIKTQRIAPGERNTWYCEVLGMRKSARYSSKNTNSIEILDYSKGGEQVWQRIDMGHETAFGSMTGSIFEFGFPDLILQMWAAFLYELEHGAPLKKFAGCVRPDETAMSHRLFTAALESHREQSAVRVDPV